MILKKFSWEYFKAFALGISMIIAIRLFDYCYVFYTKVRDSVRRCLPRGKRT